MFNHARFNVILAKRPLMPWIVFAVCVALTLIFFLDARDSDRLRLWLHLKADVETWGGMLGRDVEIGMRSVEHLDALMETLPEVDRSIFKGVATTIQQDHKAIRALEWIPRVPHDRRSEYEAAARRDGFPGFQFTERSDGQNMIQAGRRDEYFPVYFVEPYENNKAALGYDLASESARKEMLETARDRGTICASQPITLVQQGKDQRGILIVKPVYHGGKVVDSTTARRKNLKGYVLAVMDVDDIADTLVVHWSGGPICFSIYDMDAPPSQRLLHTYSSRLEQANKTSLLAMNSGAVTDMAYVKVVKVANRTWTLVFSPSADNDDYARAYGPWFLLVAGVLLGALVGAYLNNQLDQTKKISALVESRTRELAIANQQLRNEIEIRRDTEAALEQSETKYRIVADNTYDWEYWMGPEKQLLYCSPSCERITGHSAGEFIADSQLIGRIVHPEDREAYVAHAKQINSCRHVAPSELVFRIIHRDGSVRWIQHLCQEAIDLLGRASGRRASNRDITESKVAEEMLRLSEENQLTFFNTIHDMLFVLDEEGKILRVNKTTVQRLGYEEEELIGHSVLDVHPEAQRAEAGRIVADMLTGKAEFCPVPLLTKGGKLMPVETRVTRGRWNRRPALFGTCKDVTALRVSEEKFAMAFRGNPSPMAITSLPDRCFLDVNEAFLTITGYARSEVIGSTSAKLGLFIISEELENTTKIITQDGHIRDLETAVRRKNGDIRYGLFSADVVELQDRRILLSVMHDITERKQAEGRERARQQVLEMLAAGAPLKTILEFIIRYIEIESPGSIASILLADPDGKRLRHGAAPNLPDFYNDAVDGLEIADGRGSCGTAAATRKTVIVKDVETHPYWVPYRELTRRANIRACWSEPVLSVTGRLLGTFAIYYRTPHSPGREEQNRIQYAARVTSTVVEHCLAEEEIRRTRERFLLLVEQSPIPMAFSCDDRTASFINREFTHVLGYTAEDVFTEENWWPLAYPDADKRRQYIAKWEAVIAKQSVPGTRVPPDEYEVTCKDGSVRVMEISGIRVHDGLLVTFVDLTARKRAEETIKKAAEQVRLALKSSGDSMWDWDLVSNRIDRNERWYELRGLDPRERCYDQADWKLRIHPDDVERVMKSFQDHVDGRTSEYREELRILRADGSYRWVFDRGSALRDNSGRAIRILGFETDITERRRFEENLRMTQFAVDNIRDGIFWCDATGSLFNVNDAACQEFGYTREEMLALSVWNLDSQQMVNERWETIWQLLEQKGSISREFVGRRKSGEQVPIQVTASYLKFGEREMSFAVVQDISERKLMENDLRESEEKFRLATTTARDAIIMLDSDDKVTFWNKAAEEMIGYSGSEAMGRELHSWLAPERYHDAYRNGFATFQNAGQGAAVGKTLELTVMRKDGVEMPVELSVSATQFGGRWHALAIMRDVTERQRVMEDLRQAKEGADAANKAKSQFLARMSHEIRTPLNAVLGFTQLLLRDTDLAASHRSRLETIRSNGEHLLALITDVLDMSKIETGRLTLQHSSFDLTDLLKDVENMFRARARARQLLFGMEVAAEIPRYVCGDRGKIQQVLVNLIGNATKFTSRGGIMVRVRETEKKGHLQQVRVEVEDTGRGVSPEEINQLFQPFVQAGKSLQSGTGSGLGLYISRQFAQIMGGDITVTSQVGVGSVFRFDFMVELSTASPASKEKDTHVVKTLRPGQPPCRVLIVDDVKDNRVLLDQMLSLAGFVCFQATNGFNVLTGLKEWRPHLILMDVHMPGMDGNETIQRIRAGAEKRDVKIIGVTASAFEADRQAMLAAGADGFLAKPIRQESLFAQIKALLGVEYLYEDEPATTATGSDSSQPGLLTRMSMASLPAALLKQMHEAVVIADFDRVMELIQQVETQVPLVAHSLRQLAEQFDSEKLLELTETETT